MTIGLQVGKNFLVKEKAVVKRRSSKERIRAGVSSDKRCKFVERPNKLPAESR